MTDKLYYLAGACSLAPHIALAKLGQPYEAYKMPRDQMKSAEYLQLNPKGVVPTLQFNGKTLVEGGAILLSLVDAANGELGPMPGDPHRYDLYRWLSFIDGSLHPAFGAHFAPARYLDDETQADALKAKAQARVADLLKVVAEHGFNGKDYLVWDKPTVADYLLFTVLRWTGGFTVEKDVVSRFPQLVAFMDRMAALPEVQKAMAEEELPPVKAA
jgi:glutathione S-transferase